MIKVYGVYTIRGSLLMYLGIAIFSPSIAIAQWLGAILGCLAGSLTIREMYSHDGCFPSFGRRSLGLLGHLHWGLVLLCASNRSLSSFVDSFFAILVVASGLNHTLLPFSRSYSVLHTAVTQVSSCLMLYTFPDYSNI